VTTLDGKTVVGVLGAGTMGAGIAQVAAVAGHRVVVVDARPDAVDTARASVSKILARQVEKGRMTAEQVADVEGRMTFTPATEALAELAPAGLVIEAIVEDLAVKRDVFRRIEAATGTDTVLGTNTSSLSVTAIAAACERPERVIGIHFFNPAPLLPLVEVVPGLATPSILVEQVRALMIGWGKSPAVASDTPGFIVNRIARPFYSEALRIAEEGLSSPATIDWAMREGGKFRMGPFELMDLIGHDVNYAVTETVFAAFGYDPRYRPSLLQRRLVDAGRLGRKSGQGFFDYRAGAVNPEPDRDQANVTLIFPRILALLVNQAADALFWGVASREDIDTAMTKGVNYPKGLLAWGDEIGLPDVLDRLDQLHAEYGEDRYRASPLLRRLADEGKSFYP
jgi:3-hydroxybutyryl-CoA dehydrogenase